MDSFVTLGLHFLLLGGTYLLVFFTLGPKNYALKLRKVLEEILKVRGFSTSYPSARTKLNLKVMVKMLEDYLKKGKVSTINVPHFSISPDKKRLLIKERYFNKCYKNNPFTKRIPVKKEGDFETYPIGYKNVPFVDVY